ncbi:MAG: hypothetical protein NZ932_03100 [Candidatus Bathyarchaeota archaeon]|nr:hypothetical protein [Candidatus Bathyarchaeota archaeon]
MNLEEILAASARITLCPKCGSKEGFWLGAKRDHAYVQCKGCGASFELYKIYTLGEKGEKKKPSKF